MLKDEDMVPTNTLKYQYALVVGAIVWYIIQDSKTPGPAVIGKSEDEYHYVIVGGGTAGCVLAARLSEDPNNKVVLLEAGPEETDDQLMSIPYNTNQVTGTEYSWKDVTTPQEHACKSNNEKRCSLLSGRGLGGGSSINGLIYSRGNRHDYDRWASGGCEGWSYADVLPYFLKAEHNHNTHYQQSPYHATDGPLHVEDSWLSPASKAFLETVKDQGYRIIDLNGKEYEGFGQAQQTSKKGVRWSTAKAYLRPAMKRTNLHVLVEAYVTKVLFDGKRAIGVEYILRGVAETVRARREVVLSAGALATPKILMLSGIGHKEHLQSLGIPVVADLPVGDNLQDHPWHDHGQAFTDYGTITSISLAKSLYSKAQYMLFGTGPLSLAIIPTHGFVKTPNQPADFDYPVLQQGFSWGHYGVNDTDLPIKVEFEDITGITMMSALVQPYSRGTVRLASTNAHDRPLIDIQYLSDPRDIRMLVDSIKMSQALLAHPAMKKIGTKPRKVEQPACDHLIKDSDEYLVCYLRHSVKTQFHYSGTCKMGAAKNPTAVVDPSLRVRGVDGLRVVDASVMPIIVTGNTNAPVIMIAEKAADITRGKKLPPLDL